MAGFALLAMSLMFGTEAKAASPSLPLGAVYTYDYCVALSESEDCYFAPKTKRLQIEVARLESTAQRPLPAYVFTVRNEGRSHEVKIDQALWDNHVERMFAHANSQSACESGNLPNGSFEPLEGGGEILDGTAYQKCSGGADSEFQSTWVTLIPVRAPMPFLLAGAGDWPTGAAGEWDDYEEVKKYYRNNMFMATEYLELLGLPSEPGARFAASFSLVKIDVP